MYPTNDLMVLKKLHASTSLPSNTNAPIWSMSIEIHGKFLLGRLLLSLRPGKVKLPLLIGCCYDILWMIITGTGKCYNLEMGSLKVISFISLQLPSYLLTPLLKFQQVNQILIRFIDTSHSMLFTQIGSLTMSLHGLDKWINTTMQFMVMMRDTFYWHSAYIQIIFVACQE